jgi:hypothetical protein
LCSKDWYFSLNKTNQANLKGKNKEVSNFRTAAQIGIFSVSLEDRRLYAFVRWFLNKSQAQIASNIYQWCHSSRMVGTKYIFLK